MKNTRSSRNAANFSTKLFAVAIVAILMSQTIAIGQTVTSDVLSSGAVLVTATPQRLFYARNYGGKCLDFGAPPQVTGGPVYLYGCNNTIAQQIRVVEINQRHEVRLYLGNKVLGVKQPLVNNAGVLAVATAATTTVADIPLELQNEADLNTIFSRTQIFALDGDSIIWAANRDLVVKVQNARGANRTPLVVSTRNLSDEELWDFTATDGSAARPTTGFVHPTQASEFVDKLNHATWGTVIEVSDSFDLRNCPTLYVPAGVTIRGDRRRTNLGPEFLGDGTMFEMNGNYARVTGLRLRGPSRSTDRDQVDAKGVVAHDRYITFIDHNDISDWTIAAVEATNDGDPNHRASQSTPPNSRIVRNFIHHNQQAGLGYGVVVGGEAFALIEGNTFMNNRHAIAGDGSQFSGYRARLNLVQFSAPVYGITNHVQQDFDMHGLLDTCGQHCGGIAGFYMEIGRNTFLGGNRINFRLRGTPINQADFHDNVLVGSQGDAIENSGTASRLVLSNNQFNATNPTSRLGVGDFDGDGKDDLFLATGAAWYYASAGNAEWRLLSAQTDKLDNLMFGDFDGDGRTDVFMQHGYNWDVSWGGRSKWETINVSGNILGASAIGDFDGDHRADVFYADGQHWYISYRGTSQFTLVNDSSFRVPNLRFGDFNGDGKSDVFGVGAKYWQVSYSATGGWAALQPRLTDTAANLFVADFNGDGRADVATFSLATLSTVSWKFSSSGMGGWSHLRTDSIRVNVAAIGRFDGNRSTDLLLWHENYLDIAAGGIGATRQSRQDMR